MLGLNHGEVNTSAALVCDGVLVAGAPEERFNREKATKKFPHNAVTFCLDSYKTNLADCDAVAQAWNPGMGWEKFHPIVSGQRRNREDYFYSIPDNLFNHLPNRTQKDWVQMSWPDDSDMPPLYHVRHHAAHSANAFFLSPFKDAAILTCDFRGEFECTTFAKGHENNIEVLKSETIPQSLGMFYATFTELLGYRPDNDEWKVMALSAFDVDHTAVLNKLRQTYKIGPEGFFELDQAYFKGASADQPKLYTQKLVDLLGGRVGLPGEEANEWHWKIAKAMQICAEEVVYSFLEHLYELTKCQNVVLGGGFFMNSVLNGKIIKNSPFENIYISYAPSDVGNSVGAALYVAHCILDEKRDYSFKTSLIGPDTENDEILKSLERRHISAEYFEDIEDETARILSEGNIVAVISGRMEFGERALGNRSILADPRPKSIKDKINSAIKYRESYRPFAPSVLKERVQDYFEVPESFECPHMEKVVPVKQEWHDILSAITHVDGSGRVQTVCQDENPRFYRLIERFNHYTGIPIILNTSFNVNGEPIVCSADDALTTFFNSGLDYLALGNYLVKKTANV